MKRKIPIDGLNTFGPKEKEEIKNLNPKNHHNSKRKFTTENGETREWESKYRTIGFFDW